MADEPNKPEEQGTPAEEAILQPSDANLEVDNAAKASVDDMVNAEGETPFDVNAHADQILQAYHAVNNGQEEAPTGFTDSSGFHEVDPAGRITGENNPTFGSLAAQHNPNDWGSVARRSLEDQGVDTQGRRLFDFSGENAAGKTIWSQPNTRAPRTDLRFQSFPKAPRPIDSAVNRPAVPDANLPQPVTPVVPKANDQMQLMDEQSRKRKRKLAPTYPASQLAQRLPAIPPTV